MHKLLPSSANGLTRYASAASRTALTRLGEVKKKGVSRVVSAGRVVKASLREASPRETSEVVASRAPELGVNYLASGFDNTVAGQRFEQTVGVKPSAVALAVSALLAFFAPRRMRKTKRVATALGLGTAHATVAHLGASTPRALARVLDETRGTAGTDDATGDAAPVPGERTDA